MSQSSPPEPPPPRLIEEAAGLADLIARLRDAPVVAVDTESNSMHAYQERVCLLQFTAHDEDFIVDPLAVDPAPLGELFEDPTREKIFHAAEYDVICLRRDYGWAFHNLFDTMLAARILGWKKFGLGSVLDAHFGVTLNKKMQRHDWGRRPLTDAALRYARLDTHYLHRLREVQLSALDEAGRVDEARAAFGRVATSEGADKPYDLDGYWKIKGSRKLSPASASALRQLWGTRDAIARRLDRPHFKVVNDAALLAIATALPADETKLRRVEGVPPSFARRHGARIMAALRRAAEREPPSPPSKGGARAPSPADKRLDQLMAWRKQVAAERDVETDVIVTKKVLRTIADAHPNDLRSLEATGALDDWQRQAYGEQVLDILAKGPDDDSDQST